MPEEVAATPAEPTPAVEPAQGITPGALASDQPAALPDQSILSDRVAAIVDRSAAIDQRRTQETEYKELQEELQFLRRLHGEQFTAKYDEVSGKIQGADDDQSQVMKKIMAELDQLKVGKTEMEQRLVQQQEEQDLQQAQRDISAWVKSQAEFYPLINDLGEPALVLQKILEYRNTTGQVISETRAARELEEQLGSIVDRLAPRLGYVKSEAKPQDSDDPVSINPTMVPTSGPSDYTGMTDEERMEAIIRKHTQG